MELVQYDVNFFNLSLEKNPDNLIIFASYTYRHLKNFPPTLKIDTGCKIFPVYLDNTAEYTSGAFEVVGQELISNSNIPRHFECLNYLHARCTAKSKQRFDKHNFS